MIAVSVTVHNIMRENDVSHDTNNCVKHAARLLLCVYFDVGSSLY